MDLFTVPNIKIGMNLHFHSHKILLVDQLLLVGYSKSNFCYPSYPDMGFKEIYCNDCKESLGEYNQEYFSQKALGNIISVTRNSLVHRNHDISICSRRR